MSGSGAERALLDRKDPLVGQTLGGYVVKHFLGRGGMSVVYLAEQPDIGKAVAIKILKDELVSDANQLGRLMEEARIVSSLHHRGIVDVFTFGTLDDGRPYLVMEFLEGEPLDGYLTREGGMTPENAVAVLDEVLAAMAVAHKAGVVHRDLKPGNLFWAFDSSAVRYIKILDFGLAKRSQQPNGFATQTAFRPAGTPEYMAPEQARGERVSPRSDLYSLGVTAFELLTGELPFRGTTLFDILRQHMHEPPPRVSSREPSVPPSLDQLVDDMLRKEPEARPPSADDVRRRLKAISQELQRAGTRVGPSPTLRITEPLIILPAGAAMPGLDSTTGVTPRNAWTPAAQTPAPAVGLVRDTAEGNAFMLATRRRKWLVPAALGLLASAGGAGWLLFRAAPVAETMPPPPSALPVVVEVPAPLPPAPPPVPPPSHGPSARVDAPPARATRHAKAPAPPAPTDDPTARQVLDAVTALERQRQEIRNQGGSLNRADDTMLEAFRRDLSSPHPSYGLKETRDGVEHIRQRSGVGP